MYVAIQTFMSFFQGPIFSAILLGMFWPRATQWGGLVGVVGGICVSVLFNALSLLDAGLFTIEDPFLYISWWTFVVGVLLNVATSLMTQRHPEARLAGLVCRLPRDLKGTREVPAC
jgi:SSS family solute:Na+ symporter